LLDFNNWELQIEEYKTYGDGYKVSRPFTLFEVTAENGKYIFFKIHISSRALIFFVNVVLLPLKF
jgi:hypothetical protein